MDTSVRIREYTHKDIPALSSIWSDSFGDTNSFILTFFEMLPKLGTCIVLEENGTVTAEASIIEGCSLYIPGIGQKAAACIYAVAVRNGMRGRGYGRAVMQAALRIARERGSDITWVHPADMSLFDFYKKSAGMDCVLRRDRIVIKECPPSDAPGPVKISAARYNELREEYLFGTPHLILTDDAAGLLELVCDESGGGLFCSGDCICAAGSSSGVCTVYETVPGSRSAQSAVISVAHSLRCSSAEYYLPSAAGEPFISSADSIPPDSVWNIAFE